MHNINVRKYHYRIAYITPRYDGRDIHRGSGTFYHLGMELQQQGHEVQYLGPYPYKIPSISRVCRSIHRRLGKKHALFLDPFVGWKTGELVSEDLQSIEYDIVLTNDCAVAAYIKTPKPVVLYTDVMITPEYVERRLPYANLSNLSPLSLLCCRKTIRDAVQRADLAVFPATWSAEAAVQYGADSEHVVKIPFGANIEDPGPEVASQRSLGKAIDQSDIDLLFIGKDWKLKGGEIAVETVFALRSRGMNAQLHIVGAEPQIENTEAVVIHGYLDKTNSADKELLTGLFHACNVFILPSSFEGLGIAPLEAAAYGIPALGYATSGLKESIRHRETGYLLEPGSPATEFADCILYWFNHPGEYMRLVRGARRHFEQNANWPKNVQRLMQEVGNRFRPAR